MAVGHNLALPFYRFAESRPDNVALRVDGNSYSYADLGRHAQGVANWIGKRAPEGPQRVAILGGRSCESYAGLLGACWSGAAYVPLNPRLPAMRLRHMLDAIQPDAVLLDAEGETALAGLANADYQAIRVRSVDPAPALHEPAPVDDQGTAYILFTSGSTGVPKGVRIAFGGVSCFLAAMAQRYPLVDSDRVAQPCDLSFDISVSNIFTAWNSGAAVYVVPAAQSMAPRDFLRAEAINAWFSTPSVAVFLEQMKMLRPGIFPALRYGMFGGDGLPASTAERWLEATPNGTLENIYGPTEITVACTGVRYTGAETVTPGRGIVAIGTAFPGTDLRVLDEAGRKVPAGQPGELLIGGPQVGLGYWNNAELTEARFPVLDGQRWYRSGDSVYRDANGLYHFLGRLDNQVKIRGYRVELGEIEAHLRAVCSSNAVAAVPWPVRLGSASGIVAFVSGTACSAVEIQQVMRDRLPAHSVPNQVRIVDRLPVGLTGKIDRRALAAVLDGGN
ncbi:MAG: amino acid adenylation domain-containing protein [Bryobacteraceae bacterium]